MSFVFETPRALSTDTFAGGEGSLGEIFLAGIDQLTYVDNSFASQAAEEEAYDRRIDEVFAATGVRLDNPMRALATGSFPSRSAITDYVNRQTSFGQEVAKLAANIPDQTVVDRLTRSVEGEAIGIARASDERLATLMESRAGLGKWVASFAGGMVGSLRDPVTLGSLFIGGGVGAGRTVAQRILGTAAREAFVNAGTEAAVQPLVQAWRRKAGLDSGFDQAAANVLFASALGGFIGGAGRGAAELLTRLPPRARAAAEGDLTAARELLPEIREAMKPAARGALDHLDTLDHLETVRPRGASPEIHERAVTAAHRAVEAPIVIDTAPRGLDMPAPDPARVARLADEIAGPSLSLPAPDPKAQSLVAFLRAKGGLRDQNGELKAIGGSKLARKQKGKEDARMPLDRARELAEEAGYIGRAGQTQVTTVADLLDAIDGELRGNRVYARDADPVARADIEDERRRVEDAVAEIIAAGGPGLDDAIVRRAATMALREGADPLDALERAVMATDAPEARPQRTGDALPGWSDAELDAASAGRALEPDAEGGIARPGETADEMAIDRAAIEEFGGIDIVGDDGRVLTLSAYMDQIQADDDAIALLNACRV